MQYDTELTDDELSRMINPIAPASQIREATPVDLGHHIVYRLTIEFSDVDRVCYLKATPKDKDPTVNLEARLLAILAEHTEIPVPGIYGAVDEHNDLPAPYILLEAMPGEVQFRTELPSMSDQFMREIAYETGRYLAELHALDAVDAFGFLAPDGPTMAGGQPRGCLETIRVADPVEDWKQRCRESVHEELENIGETRFADLVDQIEPVIEDRIVDLKGPFHPVLARIDQSVEQILLDGREVTCLLDWEFTIASTPADDITYVTRSLAGGPYLWAPEMPDRRELIREALLDGYIEVGPTVIVDQVQANWDCYELIATLRSMVHLREWYELFDLGESIEPAAAKLRDEIAWQI